MIELTSELLTRARIPEKFWNAKLMNIPDEMSYKVEVKKYIAKLPEAIKKGYGMMLYSPMNSTGKTALACIIGKRALQLGHTVLYMPSEMIADAIIQNWIFDEYESYKSRLNSVDILIVDDLNQGYKSAGKMMENKVEYVVRNRVQHNKVVIATSNLEPAEVKEEFSKDFSELCKESLLLVRVEGIDWRDIKKKELRDFLK